MATVAQKTGTAATVSIVAAIVGFITLFMAHPVWGLFLGILAVLAGLVGLISAASPKVSGGIISIMAVVLGGVLVIFSIFGLVGSIIF